MRLGALFTLGKKPADSDGTCMIFENHVGDIAGRRSVDGESDMEA